MADQQQLKAARVDISLLAILAECETSILPQHAETHHVVLAFYVPAHLADDVVKRVSVSSPRNDRVTVLRLVPTTEE